MIEAKIILDSVSETGHRLTTFELNYHRMIHSEFMTHRLFSRNSASSRAIPIEKQIEKIYGDLAWPLEFGANQPGMQAGEPLSGDLLDEAEDIWELASWYAIGQAKKLLKVGVHKQVTNRLLEPFMWHRVIVTSVDYGNFYRLRNSPLAQPEIEQLAKLMYKAYNESEPTLLSDGEWHLPYISHEDCVALSWELEPLKKISAARCGRVSYLTHDGVRDVYKDLELYERLTTAEPPHASPLEHVATPCPDNLFYLYNADYETSIVGNFPGWLQLRHENLKDALAGGGEQGRPYVSKN